MSLPVSQDTTLVQEGYVKKESVNAISFTAGAAYSQGDFHSVGNFFGIVSEDVANGAVGSLIVQPGIELEAIQASVVFAVGNKVYYTAAGAFSKTYLSTSKAVGVCTVASNASDVFRFTNYGYIQDRVDDDDLFEVVAVGEVTLDSDPKAETVTGVLATDKVVVSLDSYDSTRPLEVKAAASADTVTFTGIEADVVKTIATAEVTMDESPKVITLTGALETDKVIASITSDDTTGAGVITSAVTADTVTITSSQVTTGDGVVTYTVQRATPAATGDAVATYVVLRAN